MLRPTPYQPARGAFPRTGVFRAIAAGVLAAGVVGLTACGSSSPSTTTSAAEVAYQTQANAICKQATAAAQPLYARMVPLERTKHLPALSDITLAAPRNRCPWPKPVGSAASFAKTSIRNGANAELLSVPMMVVMPPAGVIELITGKF